MIGETINSSIMEIDTNFNVIHHQLVYLDIVFSILFVLYIIFILLHSNDFVSIINHPVSPNSSIQGNRSHFKRGIFLVAKVILIISLSLLASQVIKKNVTSSSFIVGVGLLSVMLLRVFALKIIGFLTSKETFYKTIRYSNNCQVVIFSLAITPFIILPYCLGRFFEVSYVIIALYCILHISRTVKLLISNSFSLFDVFLYLCTLEILPIVMLASLYKLYIN